LPVTIEALVLSTRMSTPPPVTLSSPCAWHGGWWLRFVADRLKAARRRATLTRPGERALSSDKTVNLSTHIDDIFVACLRAEDLSAFCARRPLLWRDGVSGVADRMPERIGRGSLSSRLVPADGKAMSDLLARLAQGRGGTKSRGKRRPVGPADFGEIRQFYLSDFLHY